MDSYSVLDVSDWKPYEQETLGTKRKVWIEAPDKKLWLFKHRHRAETGDDWAEKVAAEIAGCLGLPHAHVELATMRDEPGVVVLDFTDESRRGALVLGNQLLFEQDPQYPHERRFHVAAHTVDRVLDILEARHVQAPPGYAASPGTESACAAMTGYLLLDALIGNQDRHHENWGILVPAASSVPGDPHLAPSFDHAASLGQILLDSERAARLASRDEGYGVPAYARRARSALYESAEERRPLTTFEAAARAARRYPRAAESWCGRLGDLAMDRLADLVEALPAARVSPLARRFAIEMLRCNRESILERRSP